MDLYLAGADSWEKSITLDLFKYPHRLASYHYLRQNPKVDDILAMARTSASSWIMDSGLYSLMFGSEQGTLTTMEQAVEYTEKYLETMRTWDWQHVIVECDVQRLLGVEQCQRLREDYFEKYEAETGREVMYVWHLPDGEQRLREMAAKYRRIALSVPELRAFLSVAAGHPSGAIRSALIKLLSIIRKSGEAKVHLLGCTEGKLLDLPADTGDSTSWIAAGTWGKGKIVSGTHLETVSIYSPKYAAWIAYLRQHDRWRDSFDALDRWVEENRTEEQVPGAKWYSVTTASGVVAYWMLMEAINARG